MKGQTDKALKILTEALDLNPGSEAVHLELGKIYSFFSAKLMRH